MAYRMAAWNPEPVPISNTFMPFLTSNSCDWNATVEGFEMVSIGRLGLSLMRGVMNVSGDLDAEDRATLQALKGVKSLTIIDFEDTSEDRKKAFGAQVETILSEMEMILEAKDEGDAVRIFGTEDGDRIRDIILYSRDGTLLITKGIIDVGQLGSLADMAQ